MPKNQIQMQSTIVLSAHQKKTVQNIFSTTMEFLEKYIEIAGYYGDWEQRKQINNNEVIRKDIIGDPEKAEKSFSVTLFGFRQALENKPEFFRDELKEEFYRWISATGIDARNAHPRLKNILFGFHEILEGRGEKIMEDVISRKDRLDVNSSDYAEKLNNFYSALQVPLEKGREQEELLKNKTYRDVETESKFGGNSQQGEQVFNQIAGTISGQDDFHFFKQKNQQSASFASSYSLHPTNSNEVVQEVKTNPKNWVLDEVITEFSNFGEAKQEFVLYCQHARLDDYLDGKLNFNNNPIYRWESFNSQQRFEIKQTKNITSDYLTDEEIKWIVREVKDNPSVWKIEAMGEQTYLIHNSAQRNNNEVGTLIHDKRKFNNLEWKTIENSKIIETIKSDINSWKIEPINGNNWLVNNQAQKPYVESEIGRFLHPKHRFSNEEWAEIENVINSRQSRGSQLISNVLPTNFGNKQNYRLETTISTDQTQDNGMGTGKVLGILGIISAVIIASVVVVKKKKQLNKKVKK